MFGISCTPPSSGDAPSTVGFYVGAASNHFARHGYCTAPVDRMLTGLSTDEAGRRLAMNGANALPTSSRHSLAALLLRIVREPMFLLLIAATAIYIVFGDLTEAITLGGSVVVIMVIELVQEHRTENALEALRDLASPAARVLRDGRWAVIDARGLVPGDAIQIAEGDRVPADARLAEGALLSIDESLLTGESVPVVRDPSCADLVSAGTLVTVGHAIAEVTATGPRSEMGRIGATLGAIDAPSAPIQREVAHIVPRLAIAAIALSVLLVVIRGISEGHWLAAALSGITLAMSLLPEEMPVVLSVFFTLGARRIARHGVLARHAAAVETLGAVTVLCVDKTGTLTENRMSIGRLVTNDTDVVVGASTTELPEAVHQLVELGLLACPHEPTDPMDHAIAALAGQTLAQTEHVHPRWLQVREYPLRTGLLAVTHVWRDDDARIVVATKGAPEAILDLCHLTPEDAEPWRARATAMAHAGIRVLGVARATSSGGEPPGNPHDYAFEIVGLLGLADSVRADTAETVARCRAAGIRVIMVTGDHPETARAIASTAGLVADDVITGAELDTLDDVALASRLATTHVVARAVPAHKLRIVRALKAAGEVVGMTGDGVNDAPALAAADIGIAMGGRGSDVAREAAGLILVRDDLQSIVEAVRTGRAIYDNLRSSIEYLIAVHIPVAGLALLPPLFGWGALLAPIHIVFLELVIDPTCSIVFETEPPATDIMERPPRPRGMHLLDRRRVMGGMIRGLLALCGGLAALAAGQHAGYSLAAMSSVAFVALLAGNLAILVATREQPMRVNRTAMLMIVVAFTLGSLALGVPGLAHLFRFAPPSLGVITLVALASALPVLAMRLVRRAKPTRSPLTVENSLPS